jgi:predicted DNA-binding transcriptional regulator YafY
MRADRLLSLLMLLQARGQMPAAQLAAELEVSVRTVYRDMDALSAAGVPVYATRGPGGGCALLDGYRTSLTGLTQDEVRALFVLSVPEVLDEVGMSGAQRAALRKLMAALPAAHQGDEERVRARIHLDWTGREPAASPAPHLPALQRAVWEDTCVQITFRSQVWPHALILERTVEPYGLVARAGAWHLVYCCECALRVLRAGQVLAVTLTGEHFTRPPNFDLAAFWEGWRTREAENRPAFHATVRVAPALAALLPLYFGEPLRVALAQAVPDGDGWVQVTLPFERFEDARDRLLGFGGAVEVLSPPALRLSVLDYAMQIVRFYSGCNP